MTARQRFEMNVMSAIAITLSILLPLGVYALITRREITQRAHDTKVAYVEQCENGNRRAKASLDFINGNLDRARHAYQATLESPTSTGLQKANAALALEQLPAVQMDANKKFTSEDCSYPPK